MAVYGSTCTARLRRVFGWQNLRSCFKTNCIFGLVLIVTLPGFFYPIQGADTQESLPSDSINENDAKRICSSMDIRNSLESFKKLEPCEVIEGFLSILLFDSVDETEIAKISFPLLTEITDYLLLYRVNGLRSIGQLFPNLAVIRGKTKFLENALVIFEMATLQEIGLHSLTDITNGHVYIDRNPSLCFVKTIDWENIVHDKTEKNYVKSLKPDNECPVCPSTVETANTTMKCPTKIDSHGREGHMCWNKNHCQKKCPPGCKSCNNKLECCNKSCLACRDDDPSICTVCPKFSYGHDRNKTCRNKCPTNLYGYLDRRCIDRDQCLHSMIKPIELQTTKYYPEPYKIYQGSCILECPLDYTEENSTCVPCGGRCKKFCPGMNIDSVPASVKLKGCTHINGSLEIQIRGGANVTELKENLMMIEEITGYLKVVRSFSLLSLNFLKNLKRIQGQEKDGQYVFSVLDNQNLQDLWDWTNKSELSIENGKGKVSFHFNPKLCYDKILKFKEKAHLEYNFTDLEVAPATNGDKTACNITPLNVTVVGDPQPENVTLRWPSFQLDDQRNLLAYSISYVEALFKNVTLFDGKDACGQDKFWIVKDIPRKDDVTEYTYVITKLKPYTQYAFYVKTYTIALERNGSQSDIQYFTTAPSRPMQPANLHIISNSSDSLWITWLPPIRPNGPITHYIVVGRVDVKNNNAAPLWTDHNYCDDTPKEEPHATVKPLIQDTCKCDNNDENNLNINENLAYASIKFEDELMNAVYLKRPKREVVMYSNNTLHIDEQNRSDTSFNYTTENTHYYVTNLHHYTSYDVSVNACRNSDCSTFAAIATYRTKEKAGADKISGLRTIHQTPDGVTVAWEQPKNPNGNISVYIIEYKRVDIDNAKAIPECLNATSKNASIYYSVSKLIPGNYSLCVYSKSLVMFKKEKSEYIYFYIEEPSSNTPLIVFMILSIFLAIIIFFGWLYKKHQKDVLVPDVNPEYVSVYIKDDWEVPRNKIALIKELGQGSFGMVWEGVANDIRGKSEVRCAVKTVNEHATERERLEFLYEASVMKAFDTTHVVRLLGVVSEGQPTLVIMELMANGDLKSYLRSHRPDMENYNPSLVKHPPTLKQILQTAIEIADGMAYLSAKKFVHRDLAARNCMVSEDLVVKIGDFGMTRDIYETDYYRKGTKGLLPVRWMAPESLKDGVFTSSSDVWSYGVVLWEMATLASQPYQGLSNDQVLRYVIDGGVMERPENCPDKLYTLMRYCWQHKPSSRPTFLKLCQLLLEDANPNFPYVSFYHSPAGAEARASRHTPSPSQDDQSTPLRIVAERLKGYTPQSQESDDLDVDTHHQFPSISESGVGVITTANGYVSGCPTNGAATTQC